MTKRLAIIPARGGSKRIPLKNIRDFCGKPMIAHILDTAKTSKLFETIHVSTEDKGIRKIACDLGYTPDFLRPDNLADDKTPIMSVLNFVTNTYAEQGTVFDEVWLLMACAPLILKKDLIKAAELFITHEDDKSVLAVTEYPVPIEWAFDRSNEGSLSPLQPGMFAKSSNDLIPKFHDTGAFAIFAAHHVLSSNGAGRDDMFRGFVLPRSRSIDIDTLDDWHLAEALYTISTNYGLVE